jgi:glutamine amidotransferase
MIVDLLDYGVGNLHSIKKALELAGAEVKTVQQLESLNKCECLVLPGVGAFGAVMERILPARDQILEALESGVPCLGVCIGLQVMFDSSDESEGEGLGIFKGNVYRLKGPRIPHMGWNSVKLTGKDPLLKGINDGSNFYFANSYAPRLRGKQVLATADYGNKFTAVARRWNTVGTQFHPEKSGKVGLKLIENFIRFAEACP